MKKIIILILLLGTMQHVFACEQKPTVKVFGPIPFTGSLAPEPTKTETRIAFTVPAILVGLATAVVLLSLGKSKKFNFLVSLAVACFWGAGFSITDAGEFNLMGPQVALWALETTLLSSYLFRRFKLNIID